LDLFQHEFAVGFSIAPGQAPRAPGNADRIKMHYAEPLDQLLEGQLKAVVEAPDDRGVAFVSFPRRVEMEDLTNEGTSLAGYYSRKNEGRW
jgi:hypothetical protein